MTYNNTNKTKRIFASNAEVSNNTYETKLNNNDLIIGPTGAGKTTGYVIPNLVRAYGSYIVADTKGNLYKKFSSLLESKGYNVKLIDFSNLRYSCSYNPLDYIEFRSPDDYCEQDVISLAVNICPVRTTKDPFWEKSAQNVIASLIAYVLEALPKEEHNMINVVKLYRALVNGTGKKLFNALKMENSHSYAVKLYEMYSGILDVEKTWGCISQFIVNALWLFDFKESERVFGKKSDFDFAELGAKESVFFLNLSDTDRSMDTIVNIFYTQAFQTLCRTADANPEYKLDVPVRIILDDFATNTFIPDFDKLISVIRSREISVSIILQSLSQLDALYNSSQAKTIINNCDHILYLGGQDVDTAEYIAFRVKKSPETILEQGLDKAYLLTRGEAAKAIKKLLPEDTLGETSSHPNNTEKS